MTSQDPLAAARRLMTQRVPRAGAAAAGADMRAVSFCLLECAPSGMVFRLVDQAGHTLDLGLNPVIGGALRDCLALGELLLAPGPAALQPPGAAG